MHSQRSFLATAGGALTINMLHFTAQADNLIADISTMPLG